MNIFQHLCFMFLVGLVENRPATPCDVNTVKHVVNHLVRAKIWLQKEIAAVKKAQKYIEQTTDKGMNMITKAQQYVEKWTNTMENRFDREVNSTFARFILNRQNTFNKFVRDAYLRESKEQRKVVDAVSNKQYIYFRGFLATVYKIRHSNNRVARETQNKIVSFGKEVDKAATKLSSQNALENLGDDLYLMSRQVQMQQFNEYEKARSDGNTGVKQIRTYHVGSENYYASDHNGKSIAGIYDKEYTKDKIGIGQFVAVMNGVEFQTGSHDYELVKPSQVEKTFHKTEPVNFPTTPVSVTSKSDVFDQILEMRKLFKSFNDGDSSIRDYFKPVLSYLEGAWLFGSEKIDAEECQYESYVGRKKYGKSYLPSRIMGFSEHKKPLYTSWDYRILSHELTNYVSPSLLKPIFDPVSLRRHKWKNNLHTATQRYDMFGVDLNGVRRQRPIYYSYIDSLMEEIPGKDNYVGRLQATGYNGRILSANPLKGNQNLNGAFYNRVYKLQFLDAMGVDMAQKSYSDILYVAQTSHENVAGMSFKDDNGATVLVNASYAMPLEIIYLTPLTEWNPFDIPHRNDCSQVNGDGSAARPFDATCPDRFFRTPQAFFSGSQDFACLQNVNAEDAYYFRSPLHQNPVCLVGSGIRIVLPSIPSIDEPIRQRYPIMPINGEGSSVWKKLNAIEDSLVLLKMLNEQFTFEIGESTNLRIPTHTHEVVLTKSEMEKISNGDLIKKITEPEEGKHQHILTLKKANDGVGIAIYSCDTDSNDVDTFCFDHHKNVLLHIGAD